MQGWRCALAEIPDPVFAQGMLGAGVGIDPTGDTVHAPCDGIIRALQPAGHAVTIAAAEGAEVLIHVGVDTVALDGRGFKPLVAAGDRVRRGDPLIRFDLDLLVRGAPSVITPVLLLDSDRYAVSPLGEADGPIAVGDPIFALVPQHAAPEEAPVAPDGEVVARELQLPLAHGIHARPAARIRETAVRFSAEISLSKGERSANARSPVALLTLGARLGDVIRIEAHGADAQAAVDAIADLIASGMGEAADPQQASATPPEPIAAAPAPASTISSDGKLAGVTASPGLAIGHARTLHLAEIEIDPVGVGAEEEQARLDQALRTLGRRLDAEAVTASGARRSILAAHRAMLEDEGLRDAAAAAIATGASAGQAWRTAIRPQAEALRATGDAHLAERADDMRDLERRVLSLLMGVEDAPIAFPPDTILLAEDLLPSQLMALDPANVLGFCVEKGGPTSHVAILAASMGLPALVAMGPALHEIAEGSMLILDADAASLQIGPDARTLAKAHALVAERHARRLDAQANAAAPCHMAGGERIEVFANLGSRADAEVAVANGAEGCGLLRTEFLFLERETAPSLAEQTAEYQAIADALGGRSLIVRLLDVGGDKPAPYLPIPAEENPALGLRGIRVGFAHPQLLEDQIRAILRVQPIGQCRIMVPMIASIDELRRVREVVDRVRAELGVGEPVSVGVMIETPAAAVTADLLAREADFLSVGTNDLTQYALAMDRGNPAVAGAIDGLHPAVLRMIAETCRGAARHDRWTGVCGGLASDLRAVPILVGLGVTELSATAALVPEIKALVATLSMDACRAHAAAALQCGSAAEVRILAREFRA
ncbi:phosphoenolpyruvate--protein phosphotransferase [Sphingomonas desiccabilis]|uniref:phosphoenolpyruvate--protein phosphotransferase n=2 Tax=Sphingomonas desiccabilis TaxID=429134 RepID=A0A4Q2J1U1_9SPHN|nr:phosphoenolpyruvate--protein phosphotransferase [Sphingomonas desiccabilis]